MSIISSVLQRSLQGSQAEDGPRKDDSESGKSSQQPPDKQPTGLSFSTDLGPEGGGEAVQVRPEIPAGETSFPRMKDWASTQPDGLQM